MSGDIKVKIEQHPTLGSGWWWSVSKPATEGQWALGSYTGYAFTKWGARREANRLARRLRRAIDSPSAETWNA